MKNQNSLADSLLFPGSAKDTNRSFHFPGFKFCVNQAAPPQEALFKFFLFVINSYKMQCKCVYYYEFKLNECMFVDLSVSLSWFIQQLFCYCAKALPCHP